MATPTTPFIIYGTVRDADKAIISNISVVGHNRTNDEKTSRSTDSKGRYIIDLANLTTNHATGDSITIFVRTQGYTGEISFTLSGEGGIQKNINTLAKVTIATLRTNLWDGMFNTLKTGIFEISTNNIHGAMNDTQIDDEGYPQVIIYPPLIKTRHLTVGRKKLEKKVLFKIEVYNKQAETMKVVLDEVENKIWSAQDVWRGLFLTDLDTDQVDYDWYTVGDKKVHMGTLEVTFRFIGSV